jgi:hypothetical protein
MSLVFGHLWLDGGQINRLPSLHPNCLVSLQARLAVSTPLRTQNDHLIGDLHQLEPAAGVACLSSRLFAALLAQTPGPLGIPIAGRGLATIMAILAHTPFQLMHLSTQLIHLLLQALIVCSQLRILFSKLSILSLKLFDLFFLTHASILIVQVKGVLYSHNWS